MLNALLVSIRLFHSLWMRIVHKSMRKTSLFVCAFLLLLVNFVQFSFAFPLICLLNCEYHKVLTASTWIAIKKRCTVGRRKHHFCGFVYLFSRFRSRCFWWFHCPFEISSSSVRFEMYSIHGKLINPMNNERSTNKFSAIFNLNLRFHNDDFSCSFQLI